MYKHCYAGTTRVAMRRSGYASDNGLFWLVGDHLGSTAYTADGANGAETGEVRYKAWGEDRFTSGSTPTAFRFTGQRVEASLGLYYYGARWYDGALGRFTQPDTIVPGMDNPQRWDRFAYTLNNPLRYTDPTGHKESGPCDPGEICEPDGGGQDDSTGTGNDSDDGGCGGNGCDLGGNNKDIEKSPNETLPVENGDDRIPLPQRAATAIFMLPFMSIVDVMLVEITIKNTAALALDPEPITKLILVASEITIQAIDIGVAGLEISYAHWVVTGEWITSPDDVTDWQLRP